jgi:hypothetical protein
MLPVGFWFLTSQYSKDNVRGITTKSSSKGIIIQVDSNFGTWELNKYLCKTMDECLLSLTSGKALETIGGGDVVNKDLIIEYSPDWNDYTLLKVYVKSGWGSQSRDFSASLISSNFDFSIKKINSNNTTYDVVILPVESVSSGLLKVARFTDK